MKKFGEYLTETLADEVKSEPTTAAAAQARKMGLTYVGFGRYADSKGQVSYTVDKDRLVPFKKKEDIHGMYQKIHSAPPEPAPKKGEKPGISKMQVMSKQADQFHTTLKRRTKEDKKINKEKYKQAVQVNKALNNAYKPELFDTNEIEAIKYYTSQGFDPINRYLYKGHDEGVTPEDATAIESSVNTLDSAFEGTKAPFPYTVYTGLSGRYDPAKIAPGETYVFRGYLSTSLDYNTAISGFTDLSDKSVVLQIEVQKGQKAIHVDGMSDNPGNEMETLLPRGSRVKIISGPHVLSSTSLDSDLYSDDFAVNLFHCVLVEDL